MLQWKDRYVWCAWLEWVKLHSHWKFHLLTPNCCGSRVLLRQNCWTNIWFTRWLDNKITKLIPGMWMNGVYCTSWCTNQHNSLPLFSALGLYLVYRVHDCCMHSTSNRLTSTLMYDQWRYMISVTVYNLLYLLHDFHLFWAQVSVYRWDAFQTVLTDDACCKGVGNDAGRRLGQK